MMFVPATKNAQLLECLREVESKLVSSGEVNWTIKLVEKSGIPLAMTFRRKQPNINGCAIGSECKVCENDNIKCSVRGVLYKIICSDCKRGSIQDPKEVKKRDGPLEHPISDAPSEQLEPDVQMNSVSRACAG